MDVTRRSLARMLAAAAAAPALASAQGAPRTSPDEDLQSARDQMKNNAAAIAKVKLPIEIEPAFQFKA